MATNSTNFDANALNQLGDNVSEIFTTTLSNIKKISDCCSKMKDYMASGDSELAAKWGLFSTNLSVPADALQKIFDKTNENLKAFIKNTIQNEQEIIAEMNKLTTYLDEFATLGSELGKLSTLQFSVSQVGQQLIYGPPDLSFSQTYTYSVPQALYGPAPSVNLDK